VIPLPGEHEVRAAMSPQQARAWCALPHTVRLPCVLRARHEVLSRDGSTVEHVLLHCSSFDRTTSFRRRSDVAAVRRLVRTQIAIEATVKVSLPR